MMQIQRILCPIDFSDCSRRALDHAVALAKWYEATLTVFHVRAPVPISAYATVASMIPASQVGGGRETLNDVRAAMQTFASIDDSTRVPLAFEIGEGDAAREIVAVAKAADTDLIVLGTHGRSGFERFVLGSVTEKVLRKAGCPVLTVPPRLTEAASSASVTFKRILCAIDFSECSMRGLEYATSLAQEANAQLTVLYVVEPLPSVPADYESAVAGLKPLREYVAAAAEEGRELLRLAIPDDVRSYCQVETVERIGKPYREILQLATERASDLIVIGVHGRGVVDLMFFGSTAQHVVRQAHCPVLTLRT
jgi:nucleotide-binding universal stress UspA family protein